MNEIVTVRGVRVRHSIIRHDWRRDDETGARTGDQFIADPTGSGLVLWTPYGLQVPGTDYGERYQTTERE
jgi:hypothetical protein